MISRWARSGYARAPRVAIRLSAPHAASTPAFRTCHLQTWQATELWETARKRVTANGADYTISHMTETEADKADRARKETEEKAAEQAAASEV